MFSPKFTITSKILNNLTKIAEIKAIVERSKILPKRESLLRRSAVIKMAHTSTSIEGNLLAEFEVEKVLSGKKISASQKQIAEVINFEKALVALNNLSQDKRFPQKKDIFTLHKFVIKGLVDDQKCGCFRREPIYIVNVDKNKEKLAYTAPDSSKVSILIDDLIAWLKSSQTEQLHPILTSGLFHYQFVTIHPFTDGNGRVARLLTLGYLYQHNYDFRKILVLEEYYNNNRRAYYEALQTGKNYKQRKDADLSSWLEYFVEGFLHEAKKVKEKIAFLGFGKEIKTGEQVFLDKDQIKIMDFLATLGKITSSDVVDILSLSKRSAQEKLKSLLQKGLLVKKGRGPSTFYILNTQT